MTVHRLYSCESAVKNKTTKQQQNKQTTGQTNKINVKYQEYIVGLYYAYLISNDHFNKHNNIMLLLTSVSYYWI